MVDLDRVRFDHLIHLLYFVLQGWEAHLRWHLLDQGEAGLLSCEHLLVGYSYGVALTLHLADWSQLKVAVVLVDHDVTVLVQRLLHRKCVLHDSHVGKAGLPQRVGHVAAHASFPHEFRLEIVLDGLCDLLLNVVLDGPVVLLLIRDKARTV